MSSVPVGPVGPEPAATPDVRWRVLPLGDQPARCGREYAVELIRPLGLTERDEHVNDVAAVVAELVANAAQATTLAPKPPPGVLPTIYLGVRTTARYTHIQVRDAVPTEPKPCEPYEDEHGDWHGFGLGIVEALTADWWTISREYAKTVHAVVTRPGATLTADELGTLRR